MGLLDGKVAAITGAGRGVGRSEALALAREGAKVVINDLGGGVDGTGRETRVADDVVKEIQALGGSAAPNYSDISTPEGAQALIQSAVSKFGRIDILVNNAGILRDKTLLKMTDDDFDMVFRVHARGTFLCTRAAGQVMRPQASGVIINTTSMSGLIGNFGQANYGLAKAGIYGFTKIAAMELGKYGIRVHAVSPNAYTRMTSDLPGIKDIGEAAMTPDSMGPLVVYLCSDLAKHLNGRVIGIHGGTQGSKVYEFKMSVAGGFKKAGGLPTAQEIAQNIDKVLIPQPDLEIMKVVLS